jgi:leucyl aminopeptidase
MIRVSAQRTTMKTIDADLLAIGIFEDPHLFAGQIAPLERLLGTAIVPPEGIPFAGKDGQTMLLFPKNARVPRLLLVGWGKREGFSVERIRRAAAAAAKVAQSCGVATAAFLEPEPTMIARLSPEPGNGIWVTAAAAAAEGIWLGLYTFDRYKTIKDAPSRLRRFFLTTESTSKLRYMSRGIEHARIVSSSALLARDLENAPGDEIHPESLAQAARRAGRRNGFRVRIFDERQIRRMHMGGLLGVARGSHRPPRFIVMEYAGPRSSAKKPVVLVGKGVTFDAGGISLKPSAGMAEMKMDMSGAGAVIGTMSAAAELRLPVHLVGLVPATENLPGGGALKPGDIVRHYNGMTTEVDNTDAEGRLILADALAYAERYDPALIIDLATLTGAVVVALGHFATGMMGNDPVALQEMHDAGERTYERVWELPLFEEYDRLIRSDIADIKNVGGRWAGAITAGMFLKRFVGDRRWIHLDIAGTAMMEEPTAYIPRGGSGVGVRLLIDFLEHWSA